jgi:hypothetical protein
VFLISHFLIAFAFLFVIIQSTGNFKKETRSCIRRLAYLPAVIPDFAFVINTELGALSGKKPKNSEKKPVLLQEEEEAMGSSRNLTLYVDFFSQPARAVVIFCRYVIPPLSHF